MHSLVLSISQGISLEKLNREGVCLDSDSAATKSADSARGTQSSWFLGLADLRQLIAASAPVLTRPD